MAYQTRPRDPFLDATTRAMILRRSSEMAGLALLLGAVALALILGSYVPDDPGWMSATDAPSANLLGKVGATIAAPTHMILGLAGWALVAVVAAWGLRLAAHQGLERLSNRLIMVPPVIALVAVFAASIAPGPNWGHGFGLGGMFGDTVLGALVNMLPMPVAQAVRFVALPLGALSAAGILYVVGTTWGEIKQLGWFALYGVVLAYGGAKRLLGWGAAKTAQGARGAAAQASAQLRGTRAEDSADAPEFEAPAPLVARETAPKQGLLAGLVRRAPAAPEDLPEPELVERDSPPLIDEDLPPEERVKARISDAIRLRARRGHAEAARKATADVVRSAPALRSTPPLRRPKGPIPLRVTTPGAVPPAPMASLEDDVLEDISAPLASAPLAPSAIPPAPPMSADALPPAELDAAPIPREAVPQDPVAQEPITGRVARPAGIEEPKRAVVQHPARKPAQPSRRAQAEAQPALFEEGVADDFELPPLNLLMNPDSIERHHLSDEALEENARMLETVLDDYGVKGEIVSVRPGPVVTMYELEPAPGLKASRVIGLADDIARSMSALSARVSTIPGRKVIGIELPNLHREKVVLREILADRAFGDGNQRLPLALGKDIGGAPMVANLAKMPHLLIAGTTGSGKSVAINTMILSLLYKLTPEECRLIMIDPKMLELSVYDGIPHLLSPVVTDPKKAVVALKWVVGEMEDRYRKMSKMGVRNIEGYNGRVREALAKGEMFSKTIQTGFDEDNGDPIFETEEFTPVALPFIVVIVDEMADLMMVAGKEIEACIQRLAQMARASGIHLIMATQRPSVDVITGTIKANFPTRISFQVTSKVDSRTILGEMGAEQLLGMGDMLYMAGGGKITRCHGPFVSDEEVEEIVSHLKSFGPPAYIGGVQDGPDDDKESDIDAVLGLNTGGNTGGEDALYDQAVAIAAKDRKCSTSYIQRKLGIGYNKAARLVEQMEDNGVVTPANHVGKREVLVPEA